MTGVAEQLATALVGLVSGVLAGLFGIGGGLVTTPAIRLVLGYPELVAVGTPLMVIVPTAVTGAVSYARRGSADVRAGLTVGLWGSVTAILGALVATWVGGSLVLILTAALIAYMAFEMIRQVRVPIETPNAAEAAPADILASRRRVPLWALGLVTGSFSGFLGLGGGFVIVPLLGRWFGFPVKRAIGTSLVAISVLAVPGAIAHYLLGNVDLRLAAGLAIGVIPGALLGSRLTAVAQERHVRVGFAAVLLVAGAALALNEFGVL
ncbi:MAG: sulfite exporter TauE/SafE family protein [Actinomycetota bacterium]|nr:sulfite exporter TauE/SafE family protein [Actinomycetota bacterium]